MNTFGKAALGAAISTIALAATPALAQDSYIQFNTGIDYSSGDYGGDLDTDMLAVPVGVKYQAGDFHVRASTAWLDVQGPEGFIPGDGGVTPGAPGGTDVSRSGIGDVNLEAGYSLYLGANTFFDAVGKVKLPTASETKFLGTGSTDLTAQGELLHVLSDNVSVGLTGGRRFNGSSDLYDLEDVWLGGAGIYFTGEALTLGLDYEWREGSLAGAPDRSEVIGSLTVPLGETLRLQGYGYTGLSDGSPDIGGGLQVLLRFGN